MKPSKQLIDYIRTEVAAGYSLDQIRSALVRQGWEQNSVDNALATAMGKSSHGLMKGLVISLVLLFIIAIGAGTYMVILKNRPQVEKALPSESFMPESALQETPPEALPQEVETITQTVSDTEPVFLPDSTVELTEQDMEELDDDFKAYLDQEPFAFSLVAFADSIDDNFNFQERASPAFAIGDGVHIFLEIAGFSRLEEDGMFTSGFVEDISATGPNGEPVPDLEAPGLIDQDYNLDHEVYFMQFRNDFAIPAEFQPGTYTLHITVTDKISQEVVKKDVEFEVV